MQDGPTKNIIPQRSETVCDGCNFLNRQAGRRGKFVWEDNFTCKHTDFNGEVGLLGMAMGRQIHFMHEGPCTTPDWCPFLSKSKTV